MILNSPYITGSITVTGNANIQGQLTVTGSLSGTATSASYAYTASSAINAFSASNAISSSYSATASFSNDFTVLGNLTVFGTQSVQYITSSQLNISDNVITVNVASPGVRFGGLAVFDSGSLSSEATASLFWDSQNNHWVYQRESGSTYNGGMLISGPRNSGGLGNELGTTACMLLVGQGGDHLTSSMIYHDSSATCIPSCLVVGGVVTINVPTDNTTVGIFHAGGGTTNRGLKISTFAATNDNAGVRLDAQTTAGGATLVLATAGNDRLTISSTGASTFVCSVTATQFNVSTSGGATQIYNTGGGHTVITNACTNKDMNYQTSGIGGHYFNTAGRDRIIIASTNPVTFSSAACNNCTVIPTWPYWDTATQTMTRKIAYFTDGGNGGTSTAGTGTTSYIEIGEYYTGRGVIQMSGAGSSSPSDQGQGRGKDLMIVAGTSDNTNGFYGGRLFLQGGSGYNGGFSTNFGNLILQSLGGYVGIGTTSPEAYLTVCQQCSSATAATAPYGIYITGREVYNPGSENAGGVTIGMGVNRTSNRQLWIKSTDSAVNGTNALFRIQPNGTQVALGSVSTNGDTATSLALNASCVLANGVGIGGASDERVKDDIVDLNYGLASVMCLRPRTFKFKGDCSKTHVGFVAQEVLCVLPNFVVHDKLDDITVKYGNIELSEIYRLELNGYSWASVLTKAIQEQQCTINTLKTCLGIS